MENMNLFNRYWLFYLCLILLMCVGCAQVSGAPTPVVVRMLDLDVVPVTLAAPEMATPTASATPMLLPTATATPTPAPVSQVSGAPPATPPGPTPTPACTNLAEFVKNLSIGDNTQFESGVPIVKVWQIRNVGTCTWTTAYTLNFFGGEPMGGPASVNLSQDVPPGETIDISLNLITPNSPGPFSGNWVLKDATGNAFGLGPQANVPLVINIAVKPTPHPTPG
jgi:hypothetical protein